MTLSAVNASPKLGPETRIDGVDLGLGHMRWSPIALKAVSTWLRLISLFARRS